MNCEEGSDREYGTFCKEFPPPSLSDLRAALAPLATIDEYGFMRYVPRVQDMIDGMHTELHTEGSSYHMNMSK